MCPRLLQAGNGRVRPGVPRAWGQAAQAGGMGRRDGQMGRRAGVGHRARDTQATRSLSLEDILGLDQCTGKGGSGPGLCAKSQ